jgi:O-antigen/teichoic acid export membrane protein
MNSLTKFITLLRPKINYDTLKEFSWVFSGQILNVLLSFFILRLLSKIGTEDYGIYALVITISAFITMSFFGPVLQGFIRFYYHYLNTSSASVYVKMIYKFLLSASLILLAVILIVLVISSNIPSSFSVLFLLSAGVYIIISRISEFFNSLLNLIRKRKENTILQGLEKGLIVLFLFILIKTDQLHLTMVFAVMIGSAILFSYIKFLTFNKNISPENSVVEIQPKKIRKEISSTIVSYITPFFIWGLAGWIQLNGEKWIIADYLNTSDVGIYAVMMALVNAVIWIPGNIINEFLTPIIFKHYSDLGDISETERGNSYIKFSAGLVVVITFVGTLLTYLAGKPLLLIISSQDYTIYSGLLPLLCLGSGLFLIGQSFALKGLALNKPGIYLMPKILTGVFSVISNFFLIYHFGISGTAYAALITGVVYVAYIWLVNNKLSSSNLNK